MNTFYLMGTLKEQNSSPFHHNLMQFTLGSVPEQGYKDEQNADSALKTL